MDRSMRMPAKIDARTTEVWGMKMSIPDFQSIMLPLLQFAADGKEHSMSEAREAMAEHFDLSEEETRELLASGKQPIFTNRVSWAKVYLGKTKLLDSPRRGVFKINEKGRNVLEESPKGAGAV